MASKGGGGSRPSPRPAPKTPSNAALTKAVRAADATAQQAQAKANLVRAQIEVHGKQVTYDWKDGRGVVKVVDVKR